jgi:hypothetical protein
LDGVESLGVLHEAARNLFGIGYGRSAAYFISAPYERMENLGRRSPPRLPQA